MGWFIAGYKNIVCKFYRRGVGTEESRDKGSVVSRLETVKTDELTSVGIPSHGVTSRKNFVFG